MRKGNVKRPTLGRRFGAMRTKKLQMECKRKGSVYVCMTMVVIGSAPIFWEEMVVVGVGVGDG